MITSTPLIYKKITDEELVSMFREAADNPEKATRFWQPLTNLPINWINSGNYSQARDTILLLLHKCKDLDSESFTKIHKGNPYYYLAIATYLMKDAQTATFLFDAAVSEDLRTGADAETNPRPSTRFLALDTENPEQAALQLTLDTRAKVERSITLYNSLPGRCSTIPDLTIPSLRKKFLYPALSSKYMGWRTLATTFISFFIEWDFRNEFFDIQPKLGTSEPFYLHLFKGCVLFESLLKESPLKPRGGDLGKVLGELHDELGISPHLKISGTLKQIFKALVTADSKIETAIVFTGRVRNTTGHKLSWDEPINQSQYQRFFEMIASSCLHAINCLY